MSQISPVYYSGGCTAVTVAAFKNRPCSLHKSHPNFVLPTNEEVKALRLILGFSQARLGEFLGKTYNLKGCRAVSRWETDSTKSAHNPMSYSGWQLMLLAAGVITVDERIEASLVYKQILNSRK